MLLSLVFLKRSAECERVSGLDLLSFVFVLHLEHCTLKLITKARLQTSLLFSPVFVFLIIFSVWIYFIMLLSHLSPQEVDGGGVITATKAAKSEDIFKDTWRHFKRFCGDHNQIFFTGS